MSTKEAVLDVVRRMPDDATLEDIMEALYVRRRIAESERELDEGRGIPHEEVKQRLAKWLA
jgi:predicted transcriptional regulator